MRSDEQMDGIVIQKQRQFREVRAHRHRCQQGCRCDSNRLQNFFAMKQETKPSTESEKSKKVLEISGERRRHEIISKIPKNEWIQKIQVLDSTRGPFEVKDYDFKMRSVSIVVCFPPAVSIASEQTQYIMRVELLRVVFQPKNYNKNKCKGAKGIFKGVIIIINQRI